MLHTLHLVRHGEVRNPDHIVYAALDGYGLSATGRRQAGAAAIRLGETKIDSIVCSPLQRAVETAGPIGIAAGIEPTTDDRLTEWLLGSRWAGVRWEELPTRFPGEIEAYLTQPADLDFAPETIADVARRMQSVVDDLGIEHAGGVGAIVSHQDPIQALRLALTGRKLSGLQVDKPTHGCVITLRSNRSGWTEAASWASEAKSSPFPPVDPPERP